MKKQEELPKGFKELLSRDDVAKFTYQDYLRYLEQGKKESSKNRKSNKNKIMLF